MEIRIITTGGTIDKLYFNAQSEFQAIVLTGAMQPARVHFTDAVFNIGCAVMATMISSISFSLAYVGICQGLSGNALWPASHRADPGCRRRRQHHGLKTD